MTDTVVVVQAAPAQVIEVYSQGPQGSAGPQGPPGGASVAGTKTFVFVDGLLTATNGPGTDTEAFTYLGRVLTQKKSVVSGVTTTKTFAYTGGVLTGVTVAVT